jgi:hypothetical protein
VRCHYAQRLACCHADILSKRWANGTQQGKIADYFSGHAGVNCLLTSALNYDKEAIYQDLGLPNERVRFRQNG